MKDGARKLVEIISKLSWYFFFVFAAHWTGDTSTTQAPVKIYFKLMDPGIDGPLQVWWVQKPATDPPGAKSWLRPWTSLRCSENSIKTALLRGALFGYTFRYQFRTRRENFYFRSYRVMSPTRVTWPDLPNRLRSCHIHSSQSNGRLPAGSDEVAVERWHALCVGFA